MTFVMNQAGPQSSFNKARLAWERFLLPFHAMDQDSNDVGGPSTFRSEFANIVMRPYVRYAVCATFPMMMVALSSSKVSAPVVTAGAFMLAALIAVKAAGYEMLVNRGHRKPKYTVEKTKASGPVTPKIELYEKDRKLAATMYLAILGVVSAGGSAYMVSGQTGGIARLQMAAAMLFMGVAIGPVVASPFLAARLRAQKILSGEWEAIEQIPKPQPKPDWVPALKAA